MPDFTGGAGHLEEFFFERALVHSAQPGKASMEKLMQTLKACKNANGQNKCADKKDLRNQHEKATAWRKEQKEMKKNQRKFLQDNLEHHLQRQYQQMNILALIEDGAATTGLKTEMHFLKEWRGHLEKVLF